MSKKFKLKLKPIQEPVINFLADHTIAILQAEAGTGKDFCCMYYALEELIDKTNGIYQIVVVKPLIEVGDKSMGFLPGDGKEKTDPYRESLMKNAQKILGDIEFNKLIDNKKLEFTPVNFMRGDTIDNSVIIVTEAQNFTLHELITLTTRIGEKSKLLINGDILQSDIRNSGFAEYIKLYQDSDPAIGYMELGEEYQTRHPLIRHINKVYRQYLSDKEKKRSAFPEATILLCGTEQQEKSAI